VKVVHQEVQNLCHLAHIKNHRVSRVIQNTKTVIIKNVIITIVVIATKVNALMNIIHTVLRNGIITRAHHHPQNHIATDAIKNTKIAVAQAFRVAVVVPKNLN
jgi:hypothetical protein